MVNLCPNTLRYQQRLWIANLTLTIFLSCQQATWAVDVVQPVNKISSPVNAIPSDNKVSPAVDVVPPANKIDTPVRTPTSEKKKHSFSGNVSWYGPGFNGKKTASGEIFNMNKPTAAHLTLPFGTRVLVEDPKTGKSTIVKVNDRGPYVHTRVMDLSKEGGRRMDLLVRGVTYVNCLIIN